MLPGFKHFLREGFRTAYLLGSIPYASPLTVPSPNVVPQGLFPYPPLPIIDLKQPNRMLPINVSQTGYTSCMKIFGVPILPPLVTEDRRKELNEDKKKAIEIEKRLRTKRSSIDSGVMTGSYIDNLKNSDVQQIDNLSLHQFSVDASTSEENMQNGIHSSSSEADCASDSFLKTALEDPEFREFFSSTAEKIFRDNKVENVSNLTAGGDSNVLEAKCISSNESEIQLSESTKFMKLTDSFDSIFSESVTHVPSTSERDTISKCSETVLSIENLSIEKQSEKTSPPPSPRVRRNSYTLECPSTVLLEHMAREIASNTGENNGWKSVSDKKDKAEGLGFKTFPVKTQRKSWNKNICNPSFNLKVENLRPTNVLRRSKTFVKPNTKKVESNFSLPGSSRSSPLQYCTFTRSVDCIKSMVGKSPNVFENEGKDSFNMTSGSVKEVKNSQVTDTEYFIKEKVTVSNGKGVESESVALDISPNSLINNPSGSIHSNCETETSSPPQYEFSDSASQISVTTQSTFLQANSVPSTHLDDLKSQNKQDQSEDIDDIASLCSSMSISRFFPTDTASRPSTAEDVSEAAMRQLKTKHENELRELIERQRKEEIMYSQILSTSGSLSSRTTTNLSIADLYENNDSDTLLVDERRTSCSRELFPTLRLSPDENRTRKNLQEPCSDKEKEAAVKLTACVRGYLTRRLLKTEKVQQLIELIRESLSCAFSLQLEPQLKRNDLELHERLAHQLNAALYELQSIISAPATTRMAIIAADRDRLRKPPSRPSSAISSATRKSILRRQQSLNSSEKKQQESRTRTKSLSINENTGSASSGSHAKSDSSSVISTSSRKPWR